jgi:hypothetical protein
MVWDYDNEEVVHWITMEEGEFNPSTGWSMAGKRKHVISAIFLLLYL